MVEEFPDELVTRLSEIAATTLEEGFLVSLSSGEPSRVEPWTPGNEVTIKLDFEGGRVAGWVSVDTTLAFLSNLWNVLMEDDGQLALSDAQDFAGEIVNQVVGRLKTHLLELDASLGIKLSTPDIFDLQSAVKRPTVLVPLSDEGGELHVIYCFKLLDWPQLSESEGATEELVVGEGS